jgi:hypothetical protein
MPHTNVAAHAAYLQMNFSNLLTFDGHIIELVLLSKKG